MEARRKEMPDMMIPERGERRLRPESGARVVLKKAGQPALGQANRRRLQEMEGGPRGVADSQTTRCAGLADEKSGRETSAISAATQAGTGNDGEASGDAATAQRPQQSVGSAGAFLSPAGLPPSEDMAAARICAPMSGQPACARPDAALALPASAREIDGPNTSPHIASRATQTNDLARRRTRVIDPLYQLRVQMRWDAPCLSPGRTPEIERGRPVMLDTVRLHRGRTQ